MQCPFLVFHSTKLYLFKPSPQILYGQIILNNTSKSYIVTLENTT